MDSLHESRKVTRKTNAAKEQRLSAWLAAARCRLSNNDYKAFKKSLQELGKASAANMLSDVKRMCHDLAELLWHAEFPEGQQEHFEWLSAFHECLEPSQQALWHESARVPLQKRRRVDRSEVVAAAEVEQPPSKLDELPQPATMASCSSTSKPVVADAQRCEGQNEDVERQNKERRCQEVCRLEIARCPEQEEQRQVEDECRGTENSEGEKELTQCLEEQRPSEDEDTREAPQPSEPSALDVAASNLVASASPGSATPNVMVTCTDQANARRLAQDMEPVAEEVALQAGGACSGAAVSADLPCDTGCKRRRSARLDVAVSSSSAKECVFKRGTRRSSASRRLVFHARLKLLRDRLAAKDRLLHDQHAEILQARAEILALRDEVALERLAASCATNSIITASQAAAAGRENAEKPCCVICRMPPTRPKVAVLCGHFACETCWDRWLALQFSCPICREKVRPANLVRLKGWGSG